MSFYIDAGELREHVSVLEITETSPHVWEWTPVRKTWANIEEGTGKNLFSSIGIGTRDAKLVMRAQAITEHNAILWKGRHLFLTAFVAKGKRYFEVAAAIVNPVPCVAEAYITEVDPNNNNRPKKTRLPDVHFPGILTEKFAGYERNDTHAVAKTTYVLVTPKVVELMEGDIVMVTGGPVPGIYDVQKCHRLDLYKNEYEITWRRAV